MEIATRRVGVGFFRLKLEWLILTSGYNCRRRRRPKPRSRYPFNFRGPPPFRLYPWGIVVKKQGRFLAAEAISQENKNSGGNENTEKRRAESGNI